jgi:hypothetical protein
MTGGACFSYSAQLPLSDRPGTPGGHGSPCFSYSAGMLPGDRPRLPEGKICFSYSAGVPLGVRNRHAARRALRDSRRMPAGACFAYSDGMPPGDRPTLPEGRLCFSY